MRRLPGGPVRKVSKHQGLVNQFVVQNSTWGIRVSGRGVVEDFGRSKRSNLAPIGERHAQALHCMFLSDIIDI